MDWVIFNIKWEIPKPMKQQESITNDQRYLKNNETKLWKENISFNMRN